MLWLYTVQRVIHILSLLRKVTVSFQMTFPGVSTTFNFLFKYEMFSYKIISENLSNHFRILLSIKKKKSSGEYKSFTQRKM